MEGQRVIESRGKKLAAYFPGGGWGPGSTFLSQPEDFVQVGLWSYDHGTRLGPRVHSVALRESSWSQEVVFVRSGRISALIFDSEAVLVETLEMGAGDLLISYAGGHGYHILEDGTQVLEVKNGPYPGPEADRRRFPWPD